MSVQNVSCKKHFKDSGSSEVLYFFPFNFLLCGIAWGFIVIIGVSENRGKMLLISAACVLEARGDERVSSFIHWYIWEGIMQFWTFFCLFLVRIE